VLPCEGIDCPYDEKLNVGFLAFAEKDVNFPFGHGLSYTDFVYTSRGLTLGSTARSIVGCADAYVCVKATIENSGSVKGVEVAQLYLSWPASAEEPPRQLRGFVRTEELEPQQKADVVFALTKRDLSIWSSGWKLPSGEFTVEVGASSRDFRFKETFSVQ
jgi:beta-glucosidase